MANQDNNNNKDKRSDERRTVKERRSGVRFGDSLGRRAGVERRVVASAGNSQAHY